MPVRVTLDALIVKKGLKARDLAAEVGRPGDLLDYAFDAADLTTPDEPE
jgi:putative transcriptional regulator